MNEPKAYYQVRTKKYEGRNWKVVATFFTEREATKFVVQAEMAARRNFETMFDHWDVKNTFTGERRVYA